MPHRSTVRLRRALLLLYGVTALCFLILATASCRRGNDREVTRTDASSFREANHWQAQRDGRTASDCRECHADIYDQWGHSHHALANRLLDPARDDLPFSTPFKGDHPDGRISFDKTEGRYAIHIEDEAGQRKTYHPDMALAYFPLHQYLVRFPGGRWQATQIAWDPEQGEWFDVYDDDRTAGEWGHWTGRGMNWNSRCAWCHMTGFDKNYDLQEDVYHSRWIEQGISCVQCHGQLDGHAEAARAGRSDLLVPRFSDRQVLHNCASCHSLREELTGNFQPGDDYHDHFRLQTMENPALYFPDGQIRDEVFVYGSFLQSRMHAAGVSCMDCHEPHTQQLRLPVHNNQLCQSCHGPPGLMDAPLIDPLRHSRHAPGSPGNLCVECHMPHTTYMQRDPRRDHGFHIPDPLLTRELGIPNACNSCHADQSAAWALEHVEAWYGNRMDRPERERTRAIARAQQMAPESLEPLLQALDREEIPIWRATLISLLVPWAADPRVRAAAETALEDPFPPLQAAALHLLAPFPEERPRLREFMQPGHARTVRLTAASLLQDEAERHPEIFDEYRHFLNFNADQPAGAARLSHFHFSQGEWEKAIAWMRRATGYDDQSPPLFLDLAVMEQSAGNTSAAREALHAARKLDPTDAQAPFRLGLQYAETGNYEEAVRFLIEAAGLDPSFHRAHYNLGLAYARLQRRLSAVRALREAIALQPENADYHYALATVLLNAGDSRAARQALQDALTHNPGHEPSRQLLRRLQP